MRTKFIEVTNGPKNYGKVLLGRFDHEWEYKSIVSPLATGLLCQRGWTSDHLLVLDLQTGEGAIFLPQERVTEALDGHRIWVCPLFQPFLEWLHQQQDLRDLDALPAVVDLPDVPFAFRGYRRSGPPQTVTLRITRTLTHDECPWLSAPILAGTIVYRFDGFTYGVIGPSGVAVTLQPGGIPHIEVPRDAIENVEVRSCVS